MPTTNLLSDLGIMPLRAIAMQTALLLVAIVLEAMVLRQQLQLGYRPSMQYAATVNLLATSLGWVAFLAVEAVLPEALRSQVISYVLFNRFYPNTWFDLLPVMVVLAAIAAFFIAYWIKLLGLTWLLLLLGQETVVEKPETLEENRRQRYERARRQQTEGKRGPSTRALAVLQANALSFTVILVVLLLVNRTGVLGW